MDLQIVAGCFEKAKEVSMKNFVDAFGSLLTREQIKSLIYRLEKDKLIERKGGGRSIRYNLNNGMKIDNKHFSIPHKNALNPHKNAFPY